MLRAFPPSDLRSYTSTLKPRSTSSCAAASPAIPPPSTATRLRAPPGLATRVLREPARASSASTPPSVAAAATVPASCRRRRREIPPLISPAEITGELPSPRRFGPPLARPLRACGRNCDSRLVSVRPVHFAVLLGVLAACLTSVGSAAASPQFGRPQSVAKAEFISRPVAAAGPGGALTFAFVPELHDGMVRGPWKPGSPLLDPPFRGRDIVTRLRIASSPRGVIALAWVESHFPGPLNRHRIRVAVKAPGHGFSQARTVAVVSDVSDPAIQVVVADDRSVAVAWTNTPDTLATRSQLAVRWPGHAFTKPLRLSRPGREALSAGPQLAVSRGGHVLAAWVDSELFSIPGALRVARVADGRLSPVTKVSTGSDEVGEAFRLAANSEGKVALAWTIRLRSERRIANLAIGTTRSGLGGLRYLSRGRGGRGPVPAVGPRGEVAVVWFESAPRGQRKLVAANWVGGDRFTRAQELAVGSIVLPRLVVDASGRPSVLWLERGHHSVVRAVAGPRRGDFGP